jgi:hypothetical protein
MTIPPGTVVRMVRSAPIALILALSFGSVIDAETAVNVLPDDPSGLLGMGLAEAVATWGSPVAVSVVRGPDPWQDDVVFEYPQAFSLFLFGNRVWQIRFMSGYQGSIWGIFPGDDSDKIISLHGQPGLSSGDSLVYRLPWKGYPVHLRIVLTEGRASDFYLYRADF